jgi:hypothetical protein
MPKPRSPRWNELRRKGPTREMKPRYLVICEGCVTEAGYFEALRHKERATLVVELEIDDNGGVPKTLVERAVQKKKAEARKAQREGDKRLGYDAVWCVFDVDEHPNLPDARQQALANEIELAISNPCFELWALLHFQDQGAPLERGHARQLLKKHLPKYDKALPFEQMDAHYGDAVRRAKALDKRHDDIDESGANPSTSVHRLTECIRAAPSATNTLARAPRKK